MKEIIKVNDLNYKIFHNFNISFNKDEFTTISGSNKCGKTLLLRILSRKILLKEDNLCDYQENDYVYHDNFGTGKVISVDKSIVKVAFKMPYGVKTLMKNHPSIHKIGE